MNSGLKSAPDRPFNELESVDSTNNYAMGVIHDGTARDGETWFAHHQFAGRGQRGRSWTSAPGENISMSIAWKPKSLRIDHQFALSAVVAVTCVKWLEASTVSGWSVKWPNDLYWNDRKAAGILIENSLQGANWRFAVIGIGINVNVAGFPPELPLAISLRQITGSIYSPADMARQLSGEILDNLAQFNDPASALRAYNERLFRRGDIVSFRKSDGGIFQAKVEGVDAGGLLQTDRGLLKHGEAEWLVR